MKPFCATFIIIMLSVKCTFSQTSADSVKLLSAVPMILLDGTKRKISDYNTPYILIDFWGLGCPPCIENAPRLVRMQRTYRNSLTVVAINDSLRMNNMPKFVNTYEVNYDIVHIHDQSNQYKHVFMNAYKLFADGKFYGYPFYILIDKKKLRIKRKISLDEVESILNSDHRNGQR